MAKISVKSAGGIGNKKERLSNRQVFARVAYYYPAYTLKDLQELPSRDVLLMLKEGEKMHARNMHDFMQIIAAPKQKNAKEAINKILNYYQKILKD